MTTDGVISINSDFIVWKRQDKLIYSSLIGAISTPLQAVVSRATTAADVWNTLAATYANPSRGHIRQLRIQLKNWKKDDRTNICLPARLSNIAPILKITTTNPDPETTTTSGNHLRPKPGSRHSRPPMETLGVPNHILDAAKSVEFTDTVPSVACSFNPSSSNKLLLSLHGSQWRIFAVGSLHSQ